MLRKRTIVAVSLSSARARETYEAANSQEFPGQKKLCNFIQFYEVVEKEQKIL